MTSRSCVSHSIPPITVTHVSKRSQLSTWHAVYHHRSCRVQARRLILHNRPLPFTTVDGAVPTPSVPTSYSLHRAAPITSRQPLKFPFFFLSLVASLRSPDPPCSHLRAPRRTFVTLLRSRTTRSQFPTWIVRRSGHSCGHAIHSTRST